MHAENTERSFCLYVNFTGGIAERNGTVEENHKIIDGNNAASDPCEAAQAETHLRGLVTGVAVDDAVGLADLFVMLVVAFFEHQTSSSLKFIVSSS